MAEYPKEIHACLPGSDSDGVENQITRQNRFTVNPSIDMHQREQDTSDGIQVETFDISVNDDRERYNLHHDTAVELTDDIGRTSRNSNMITSATQTSDTDCQRDVHHSEPECSSGSSMLSLSSIYQGEWPIDGNDRVLWVSGPSCIGEKDSLGGFINQDTCSIMSFSSTGMTSSSMNARRFHAHQLGTKVEMVYSLLSMLGTHGKEDMSRTLLEMSSSQDSCIAMRQSGCLPLLIQLLHGGERDTSIDEDPRLFRQVVRDARRRASQALHNIVHAHPDDKRGRREARVLRLLEQIRDYCDLLRDIDSGFVEDNNNTDTIDQHPGPAIAALMKLSFDEEHRHAMCQLGGLQAIAELIQIDHEVHGNTSNQYCVTIRRYAGMALTNLTFGDGTNKALLCSMKNFMHALVAQLHSPSEDLRQVTASVLRNLSWRADTASKQMLREVGAVVTLMKAAMSATKESILKSILSALWNLSAHCTMNKADICAVDGALAFLVSTLTYKSSSKTLAIIENGGGILRNISSHIAVKEEYRAILRNHNCLQLLLQQLKSPSLTVVSNACGTLWNLSARCSEDQQALWEMGAVSMLRNLVHSKHKMISMGSSAALRNLLSARPAGMTLGLSRSMNGTQQCNGKTNMPMLYVRKQRALEAEIDQNLSETCDNIDSPKTSPTHLVTENRFTFGCQSNKQDQCQYMGYLPGRMYLSINGYISSPDGVSRSESRDSIGSTHSEPLPPHLMKNSYQIFAKSARLMLLNQRHRRSSLEFQSIENSAPKMDHNNYMSVFPSHPSRIDEIRRVSGSNVHASSEELYKSLPRPNSLPSVRRESADMMNSESPFRRVHSNGIHHDMLSTGMSRSKFYPTHRRLNSYVENDAYRGEYNVSDYYALSNDKLRKKSAQVNNYLTNYNSMSSTISKNISCRQEANDERKLFDIPFRYYKTSHLQKNRDETSINQCRSEADLNEKYFDANFKNQLRLSPELSNYINSRNDFISDDKKLEIDSPYIERRHPMQDYKTVEHGNTFGSDKGVTYRSSELSCMDDTPLMFSPCSSQSSLSSFEQHSIHDDRSSIISDISHRNSLVLSPSDLPESPGFARPSTPNTLKQPISQFTDVAPRPDLDGIICPIPSAPKCYQPNSSTDMANYNASDDKLSSNEPLFRKMSARNKKFKHKVYSDSEILDFKLTPPTINERINYSSYRAQSSESLVSSQRKMELNKEEFNRRKIEYNNIFHSKKYDTDIGSINNAKFQSSGGMFYDGISHNSYSMHSVEPHSSLPITSRRLSCQDIEVQSETTIPPPLPPPPPPPPPPPLPLSSQKNGLHLSYNFSYTSNDIKPLRSSKSNGIITTAHMDSSQKVISNLEASFNSFPKSFDNFIKEPVASNGDLAFQKIASSEASKNLEKELSHKINGISQNKDMDKKLTVDVRKQRVSGINDYEEKWKKDEQLQEKLIPGSCKNYNSETGESQKLLTNLVKPMNGNRTNYSNLTTKHSSTSSNSSPEGISSNNSHKDISDASKIRREAKKIAEKVEAEGENIVDELTQSSVSCISDIDNVLPPSVMGDGLSLSMTSSGLSDVLSSTNNGKISGERRPSLKKSRKSMRNRAYLHDTVRHNLHIDVMKISSGSEILEAVQPPSGMDSVENLSLKSSETSDNVLDNVNPPSVMDELSMTGSCASLNSISSDILESKSHSVTDAPNGKSNNSEMFERLNAAAAMVQVYSRELSNIMTGSMKSSYNSDIIDQVKPPSAFQEITEVTAEDGTEVASDTLASDTELEEELPHDDDASVPSCETVQAFHLSKIAKEQIEGSTENLVSTIREELAVTNRYKKKKVAKAKIFPKKEDITAEEALALQENAKLVVSTIHEIKNKTTTNDMIEDEIMSLVSIESEDNPKTERKGARIVKPINRETIRQMQEKKISEKSKGIRGRASVRSDIRSGLHTSRSKQSTINTSSPPSVKPTRTSALRASQNQRSAARNARISSKSPMSSYLSLSRPLRKIERSQNSLDKENIPQNTDLKNITTIEVNGEHSSTDSDDGKPKLLVKQGTFTKDKPSQNVPHISPTSPKKAQNGNIYIRSHPNILPSLKDTINEHPPIECDKSNSINNGKSSTKSLTNSTTRSKFNSVRRNNNNSFRKLNNLKSSPSAQNLGRQVNEKKFNSKRSPSATNLSTRSISALGSSQSTASNASSLSSLSSGASIKKGPIIRKDVPSKIAFLWKKSASDGCTSDGERSRGVFMSKMKSSDGESNKAFTNRSLSIRTRSSFVVATSSSGDGLSRSSTYDKLSQESSQSGSDKEATKKPEVSPPFVPSDKRRPIRTTPIKGIVHCHHSHDIRTPPINTWKKSRASQRRSLLNSSVKTSKPDNARLRTQSTGRKHVSTDSVETSDENDISLTKVKVCATGLVTSDKTENEDHQNSNVLKSEDQVDGTVLTSNIPNVTLRDEEDEDDKAPSSEVGESEEECVDNQSTNRTEAFAETSDIQGEPTPFLVTTV
ncbi:adenomatous polyposis coli protein-like isoform X1 [Centruroides vittatus]|uniref:adenomatous polyposis coli protein-like isoform X1 n=1 Tax=Centruroides vittatus TaxID=120091 RepID=UPI00350F828A